MRPVLNELIDAALYRAEVVELRAKIASMQRAQPSTDSIEANPQSIWHPHRTQLNALLGKGKRRRADDEDETKIAASKVPWQRIKHLYKMRFDVDLFKPKDTIREHTRITKMYADLDDANTLQGSVAAADVSEARRKNSIRPVLSAACLIIGEGETQMHEEARLKSKAVVVSAVADFMIVRKKRKILVVEAKDWAFENGQAQEALMMDVAIAVNEQNDEPNQEILGVLTNYEKWYFYKRTLTGIDYAVAYIRLGEHEHEDALAIVNRIMCMLATG